MRGRATGLEKKRGLTRLRPHCDEGRVSHFRLVTGQTVRRWMTFYLAGRDDFCFVSDGWRATSFSHPLFGWLLKDDNDPRTAEYCFSHPLFGWLLKEHQEPGRFFRSFSHPLFGWLLKERLLAGSIPASFSHPLFGWLLKALRITRSEKRVSAILYLGGY